MVDKHEAQLASAAELDDAALSTRLTRMVIAVKAGVSISKIS